MKKRGTCKILVAAAALCIMGTMAVMAAGKIVGYSSSHSVDEADFAAYGDLAQVDEKAGFPVKAPEKFENGYTFEQGYLVDVNAHDENGEVLETFPKVSVYYKKGGESLTLCVERVRPERQEAKTDPARRYHDDLLRGSLPVCSAGLSDNPGGTGGCGCRGALYFLWNQ